MRCVRLVMDDDRITFTLPSGIRRDVSGWSPDEMIGWLKGMDATHVSCTEEDGATGLYGDLAPGTHTLEGYIRWLAEVGEVSPRYI